jgi:nitronate monooxygenase
MGTTTSQNRTARPRDRAAAFCAKYDLRLPILLAPMAGACPVSLSVAVASVAWMLDWFAIA